MAGLLGGLGGLFGIGLCAAFCAAVREATTKAATNPEDSVVRVAGAIHASNADNLIERVTETSGAYPAVLVFAVDGQCIGHSDGADNQGDLSAGFVDVVVHQEELGPSKRTTYLQIIHDKPICLSYVLQNMTDGTPAVWTGDVGRTCGQEWYYSDARIGDHVPDCTWVDAAIQLQMTPITETTMNADLDPKQYCGEKPLSLKADFRYEDEDRSKDPALFSGEDNRPSSRKIHSQTLQPQGSSFLNLVVSHHDHHSAMELCESEKSRGPDFVSFSEQKFCDMEAKKHSPFCGKDQIPECFDGKTLSIVTAKGSVGKTYSAVERMGCPPNYPSCGERCPLEWEIFCEGYGWGVGGPIHTWVSPPPRPSVWSPPTTFSVPTPTYYRAS